MADFRALGVACEAVARSLDAAYDPSMFDGTVLEFAVYRSMDFRSPMQAGVSVYLHRVYPNPTQRTAASRIVEGGHRRRPQLALDAHLLLTAWGTRPSLEHAILGWAMRVLADTPILGAPVLNSVRADSFLMDEAVELSIGELSVEDMLRVWDGLPSDYQLSVPYVARPVRIESLLPPPPAPPVVERELEYHVLETQR